MQQIGTNANNFLDFVKHHKTNICENSEHLCYDPATYQKVKEVFDLFLEKHHQFDLCTNYNEGQRNYMHCAPTEDLEFSLHPFSDADSAGFGMELRNDNRDLLEGIYCKETPSDQWISLRCEGLGALSSYQRLFWKKTAVDHEQANALGCVQQTQHGATTIAFSCDQQYDWLKNTPVNPKVSVKNVPANSQAIPPSASNPPDPTLSAPNPLPSFPSSPTPSASNPPDPTLSVPNPLTSFPSSPTPSASNPPDPTFSAPNPSPFSQPFSPNPSASNPFLFSLSSPTPPASNPSPSSSSSPTPPGPNPTPPINPSTTFPSFAVLGLALSIRSFYQAYTEGRKVFTQFKKASLNINHPVVQNGSARKAFAHTGASILWASSALLPQYILPCALGAIGFELGAIHLGKKKTIK